MNMAQESHPTISAESENAGESVHSPVARPWYVPPDPPIRLGWIVFSEEFTLRVLQRRREKSQPPQQTAGWRILVALIRGTIAIVQAVVMLLAVLPFVNQLFEPVVTYWPRGAIGFLLRASFWKARLRHLGCDTLIDRGVEIWGGRNISIGAAVHVDTSVRLAAGESGYGQVGELTIGDFTHVGPKSHIAGRGRVSIGRYVSIHAGVHIYSASNALIDLREPGMLLSASHMAPPDRQQTDEAPVQIDDYCLIGYAALITPGVHLGRGCVVHPFTHVASSFPEFANIVGPGRARQNGSRQPLRVDPRAVAGPAPD